MVQDDQVKTGKTSAERMRAIVSASATLVSCRSTCLEMSRLGSAKSASTPGSKRSGQELSGTLKKLVPTFQSKKSAAR